MMIHPDDVLRFYFDFYSYLKKQGVDMVKVDNQAALEAFSLGKTGRVSTMRAFQEAFQGAGQHYLNGNILHCMSNSSDAVFNMHSSNAWRNSDDYYPKKDLAAQQQHLVVNAYNNIWSRTFSIPDWDMFQTHGIAAEFHGAARAISGGPVYVCDKPNKQNFTILKKLGLADGTALRCPEPAMLADDCVFIDPLNENKALKISNRNDRIGVLGLFHCQQAETEINASWRIKDVHDISGTDFACYKHFEQSLTCVSSKTEKMHHCLQRADCELITISPIENGVAALGLLDKYNGTAAITYARAQGEKYICKLRAGSKHIGFYCAKKPKQVFVNGKKAPIVHDPKNGLLRVSASEKKECRVVIKL